MEENQNISLFGLSIDPAAKAHLSEAARWARFLAIVGFVIIGLIVLIGIFAGSILGSMTGGLGGNELGSSRVTSGIMGSFFIVIYILVAAFYFFPCLFLFRFATKMKTALASNDQETVNSSFQNLKKLFRFVGIFTIIMLAIYAIALVFGLLGAGLSRM
ncbi:MAG: hypothetical protein JWM28_111 [Chitinophagaceae bacterium]|nr:hypothetical protein [Chitinophagaceae bacterium]